MAPRADANESASETLAVEAAPAPEAAAAEALPAEAQPAPAETTTAAATTPVATADLNLRAGPSYNDMVLAIIPTGAPLIVDAERGVVHVFPPDPVRETVLGAVATRSARREAN